MTKSNNLPEGIFMLAAGLGLLLVPYYFMEWSPLFSIEPVVSGFEHSAFVLIFILLIAAAFYFLNLLRVGQDKDLSASVYSGGAAGFAWVLLYFSLMSHVLLVTMALKGYAYGGFVGARDETLGLGIGVPMRFHLVAVPTLAALSGGIKNLGLPIRILGGLILARVVLMSERAAMLELFMSLWMAYRISGGGIPWSLLFRYAIMVGILFSGVQGARIAYQSEIDLRLKEIGDVSAFETVVAYYSDTLNKAYVIAMSDYTYPAKAYSEAFRRYESGNYGQSTPDPTINFGGLFDDRRFTTTLNNPGGLAQDWSDFGVIGGTTVAAAKLVIMAYVIFISRGSARLAPFVALFAISIVEYPRLNLFYQPQYIILLGLAIFISFSLRVRKVRG